MRKTVDFSRHSAGFDDREWLVHSSSHSRDPDPLECKAWSEQGDLSSRLFDTRSFNATPIARSIATGRAMRFDLSQKSPDGDEAYNRAYAKAGYSDILVLPLFNFDGSVSGCIEFATKAVGGFSQEEIRALRRVQSPLARMKEYFTERFDKQITLATYVGEATSRKVLNGQIVLGDGETISAVVLFADIIGFTALSNRVASGEVLSVLNRFFAVIDDAVSANNGEILKFLGDGALVIFSTPDDLTAQEAAASSAMNAVEQARAALAAEGDGPTLEFRAALHVGDVFYGNIGSGSRLDFTAIGPTVNLCSRMLLEASARAALTVCSAEFKDIAFGTQADPVTCDVAGFDRPVTFFVLE
jgi:adenylate cyclase